MMINKRLISMVPEAKALIIRKVIVNWLSLLAGIVLWFSIAGLLDNIVDHGAVQSEVISAFGVAVVCVLVRILMTRRAAFLTQKAIGFVKMHLRTTIYDKLRRLGASYTDSFSTAEVVQLAGEGVEQLESYFGNYLPQFFYAMLAPLTLLFVFLPLSPLTGVALFICVPLIPIAIASVQTFAKRLLGKYWDAYANLGDSFLENLQGLTTLKVYGADEARHKAMNQEAENFRVVTMKVLTMQLNSVTIMDFVAYGGTALGSILGARAFLLGKVTLGGGIAMIMLASEFFLAMRALGSFFHVAMNGMAASDRMFRLMDLPEPPQGQQSVANGDIVVDKVCFSYDGSRDALSDVSFTVKQGEMTALCGESGCGKSTLSSLLTGNRTGYTGSIRVGGVELKDASARSVRSLITVVSSNSYLFSGTVRSALLEGDPQADEAKMWRALEQVNLKEFIQTQEGLDTVLTEQAGNLSGGQRQRLALARALMKDSPVYIFDEATSNIDPDSEAVIMDVVRGLRGAHTVILISHRLSNITGADQIVFLEKGRLTQLGTHESLMAQGGGYADVFNAQKELERFNGEEAAR